MKRVLSIFSCLGVAASVVSCSLSALALEPSATYAKAKEFTVQIDGEETGTGTIIEENNGTYTVLTCWHVMDTPGNYQITTADGSTHQVSKVENLPDVDLAIITFSSDNTYSVAELGNSATATSGFSAYVVGYPDPSPGIPERSYFTESAEIKRRLSSAKKGYQIVHSGSFTPGSSGSGMFDSEARLIAVNGQFIFEGNTGKAYGTGIPLEIYLATKNNFTVPTNVTAPQDFVSVGKRKLKQKNYQEAIAEFDKALAANPNDIKSLYSQSVANYYLQDFGAAIRNLDQVIKLNPQDVLAYSARGLNYAKYDYYERAIADYDTAIRLNPRLADVYYNRGSSYSSLKKYQNAIADYDTAIRLNPRLADAYYNRGSSYSSLKKYQNAIADYDTAIRLNPGFIDAYLSRGANYTRLKKYQNAVVDYATVIRLNPRYEAYFGRGLNYAALGKHQRAIADFNKATDLNPFLRAIFYTERGLSHAALGKYQSAIADFDKAIRRTPKYARAYFGRGLSQADLGKHQSAIADFDEAIRLIHVKSEYAPAYYYRGLSYKNINNNSNATKDFEQAAELFKQQGNTEGYQAALNQIEQLR